MKEMQDLVRCAKRGDADAFVALYEMVYQDMYAYACYMLRNRADAEDVVSETVICAYETIGRLRQADRFRHWIFKILSNQCMRKRKTYLREADLPMEEHADHADAMEQTEQKQDLEAAFSVLDEEERWIVNAFLFAGYQGNEVASLLGINPSTVRSKYRRALLKMRKHLGNDWEVEYE